jgi:hypothetical protein
VCEVFQAEGPELYACQWETEPPPEIDGWCYVTREDGYWTGAQELLADCEQDPWRLVAYGNALPHSDEILVLACEDSLAIASETPALRAALGEPCLPAREYRANFHGFSAQDATIGTDSPGCDSGLCLTNHFQGRASCPYGQPGDVDVSPMCFVPGSMVPVTVAVLPQVIARRAETTSTCSCRCDGPGDGPFCTCPSGMECAPVVQPFGLPSDDDLVGSYCIPEGMKYDPMNPGSAIMCEEQGMNCGDPRPY